MQKKYTTKQKKYTTKNFKQTQALGEKYAKKLAISFPQNGAVVLALQGDLGSGKTTFLQGFAKGLGIKDKITSPTFVIYKKFQIPNPKLQINSKFKILNSKFMNFYHFDCYRLKNEKDILDLLGFSARGANVQDRFALGARPASGWKEIISNPQNIVAIEWPKKIKKILSKNLIVIKFRFINKNKREIFCIKINHKV